MMRPSTLDIKSQTCREELHVFMRELYKSWERRTITSSSTSETAIEELFGDIQQVLSEKQVRDIVFTTSTVTRPTISVPSANQQNGKPPTEIACVNGLTFGEFIVLASGMRKNCWRLPAGIPGNVFDDGVQQPASATTDVTMAPEVFLGGSCNPTTWRADVAIPALNELGISFYNPQVSHWTPALIELEHRAKEKAKVLFFVLDSKTRSTAGAIEAAHIAGQNFKYLLLVLVPYATQQEILDEVLSDDEYWELMSNQSILRQLVTRRGYPVLDNILSALELIREIFPAGSWIPPSLNLASRLVSLRRTYERVANNIECGMSATECVRGLLSLGYPAHIATVDNILRVLLCFEEITVAASSSNTSCVTNSSSTGVREINLDTRLINFEEFCVIDSCVAVMLQNFYDSSCTSPIKGTNLQQPLVYLTDRPVLNHAGSSDATADPVDDPSRTAVVAAHVNGRHPVTPSNSGTVYAFPELCICERKPCPLHQNENLENQQHAQNGNPMDVSLQSAKPAELTAAQCQSDIDIATHVAGCVEARDVYLGGSCWIKTKWRQRTALPILKKHNLTYYFPALHEGLCNGIIDNCGGQAQQTDCCQQTLAYDAAMLDACRYVVFAITNETRSLAPMTMAAHYIGLGYNVVLCVQMLSNDMACGPHKLSITAIKDYNRGRAYLMDLAKRHGIPVFERLEDALHNIVNRTKPAATNCGSL